MEHISLIQLQELFTGLRAETSWNVDGEMVWGYFFVGDSTEKLEKAAAAFENLGYEPVGIFESEEEGALVLQVDRTEAHSPETLFARNAELETLAEGFGIEYDGMDVNPVPTAEELAAAEAELAEGHACKCGEKDGECEEDCECGEECACEHEEEMPIENPELVAAIEALSKDEDSDEAERNVTVELQCASYLIPYIEDAEAKEEDSIQLLVCADDAGVEYLPLFTDVESMKAWAEEQPVAAMVCEAEEAWEMVLSEADCAGAVVNPGGLALPIERKLVELLKQEIDEIDKQDQAGE